MRPWTSANPTLPHHRHPATVSQLREGGRVALRSENVWKAARNRVPVLSSDHPLHAPLSACRDLIVSVAWFSAMLNLLYIAPSLYMLQVYDRVVPTRGALTLLALSLILVCAVATIGALDLARSRLLVRASARIDRLLAETVVKGLFVRRDGTAQRSSGMLREFDSLRQVLTGVGVLAICDIPWAPIYILICFLLHPWLGLYALLCSAILMLTTWAAERRAKAAAVKSMASTRDFYQNLDASVSGSETLLGLGMEQAVIGGHVRDREQLAIDQYAASISAAKFVTITKVARMLMQSLALGLGAYLAIEQKISAGSIFAASLLLSRALAPIESVTAAWRSLAQAQVAYANLSRFLALTVPERSHTRLPQPQGLVTADQLSVASDDRIRAVLQGVHLRVEPGEMLGVVGPSGSGKSTLLRALAGVAPIHAGTVRIDGARLEDWDAEQLAAAIGFLPQPSILFPGTIKDNIARFRTRQFPDPAATDGAVVEAAQLCGAHDMILRLPQGYDTVLGPRGVRLSAGQTQLIALSRALFGNPAIFIFDEPNSGLDSNSEAALVTLLGRLRERGATIILAAHQLRLFEVCDKLAVLRDGRLIYFGSKEDTVLRLENMRGGRT